MKLSTFVVSQVLFASSIFAAPKPEHGLEARVQRRALSRLTHPLIPASVNETEGTLESLDSNVAYSSNWAGVVIESPPSGTTWKTVTADVVVPTPQIPSGGGASSYSGSAWVGIDGDTYGNAILQTGFDFTISSSGARSYDAWYEWFPDYAYDYSGSFSIAPGQTIRMTVSASSTSAGTASLQNLSTGQTVSKSLTAPSSSSHLGGQNAEWIVEAYQSGNSQTTLPNFGSVKFSNAVATTYAGSTEGPSAGTIIDLEIGSTVYASATQSSSGTTVSYV